MKIVSLAHQKGGVGKSTLAYILADELTKHNLKVALADMDPQGTISRLSKGFSTSFKIIPYDQGLDFDLDSTLDVLLIDTPPYLSEHLMGVIKKSDLIIIPTRAGIADLLAIGGTIKLIQAAKKEAATLIVMNLVKPKTTLTAEIEELLSDYGIQTAKTKIKDYVAISRSFIEPLKHKKALAMIEQLTNEIFTYL